VIDLPDLAQFSAAIADRRFIAAVAVAILAGVVRGFSGFGSALIFVPLMAAIYDPRLATVSYLLVDYPCTMPFALRAMPQCKWREIVPAIVAAAVAVPLGTMLQKASDPQLLRWGMAVFVLAFVVVVASGWRYRGRHTAPAAGVAGFLSGFAGGATQMTGPPAILYWLGSAHGAAVVRANLLVFLFLVGTMLIASFALQGLMTPEPIALSVLLWPVYVLALAVGARWFRGASDQHYRRIAYVIVAIAALVSVPVFDGVLR
jgi:uncharacterized membrane protein YfcA